MWAVICGITLYPLKKKLTLIVRQWFDSLLVKRTPLVVGLVMCPLNILLNFGDFLVETFQKNRSMVLIMASFFPLLSFVLHFGMVPRAVNISWNLLALLDKIIIATSSKFWVIGLIIFFLILTLTRLLRFQIDHLVTKTVSCILWLGVMACICDFFGPMRAPFCCVCIIIILSWYCINPVAFSSDEKTNNRRHSKEPTIEKSWLEKSNEMWLNFDFETELDDPNLYLRWIAIACASVYVSQRLWLMCYLLVPVVISLFKQHDAAVNPFITLNGVQNLKESCLDIIPGFLHHFVDVLFVLDRTVIKMLRSSMDAVGSIAAIGLLAGGLFCLSGFVTAQLYYESLDIIEMGTNLANQTFQNHGTMENWFRKTAKIHNATEFMDLATKNMYTFGTNFISSKIDDLVAHDEFKAAQLKEHVIKSVNVLYAMFTEKHSSSNSSHHRLWDEMWKFLTLSSSEMTDTFLKAIEENIQMCWSIGETLFGILWNSSEMLFGAFGIVFQSGSAIFDFIMDMIVFLTFLFSLLCSSNAEFIVVTIMKTNLPNTRGQGMQLVAQIEESISSVFLATLKMATFYGLLTWLTHTVFAVQLVFVPSVLAAILAAVPFFGTYLATLPAVLELCLIQKEPFQAVLLFCIHFIPGYFVDDVIYSEIKSTNSFLTGMAIAGGMLWWGLEGAIFGPIILCVFIFLGKLYHTLIEEQRNEPLLSFIEASKTESKSNERRLSEKVKRFSTYRYQLDYHPNKNISGITDNNPKITKL